MGIVYKALHRSLNRLVALKMIRGGVHADDIQVTRFRIEAEAVAALRHPNILQIYDIGEADGLPYVALELLEGGSLAEKLHGTPLPPRKAAEWMVPMAMAMDTAHKAGIVHRDLKSVNILFTADGVPKVTDFGLAKRLEVDEGHTHTGQVMGTPSYMAPEQARGDTKNVGPPADIYALGAILYEMLTGRPPFKGVSAMDTVKQVIEVEPVAPSRVQYRVPPDLETICLKCLQKEVRKRYATAKDMADDLNRYLNGEPIKARRTPPIERAIKWTKRHPTVALASACAIAAAMSLVGYGGWYWNHQRTLERVAQLRDTELKKATTNDLLSAQDLVAHNDLTKGHELLKLRISALEAERRKSGELTELFYRTKLKLAEIDRAIDAENGRQAEQRARDLVQSQFSHFLDRRKEALFRDTQFTGLMLPTNLDLTRAAAEEALGVFGKEGDGGDWTLGELPGSLSSEQKSEIKEGCYELLLVLAEATAAQDPLKVDRALRVLDSADRMRPAHSRAYHMRKATCLALKGDKAGQRGARRCPAATPGERRRLLLEWATGVQRPPICRRDPRLRDRPATKARPLLGEMLAGHLLHPDPRVRRGEIKFEWVPDNRPQFRLALSTEGLCQRPDRREGHGARQDESEACAGAQRIGRIRVRRGRGRLPESPRTTGEHSRRRAPICSPGQPRPRSV